MDKSVKFRIELETNGERVLHTLSVSTDDFRGAVEEAVNESRKLGRTLDEMTQKGVLFSAMKDVVDVLNDSIGGLADKFNSFDKGMRAVNTMANVGAEELAGLKEEVEDLGDVIPLAKEELANGLYQVISNGVPKDNWIEFLRKSARSAVGGIADLGQTVTVTSTIIKNYGLGWEAAGEIQDKIQMTAKNGVTSFEQLGQALPRVTGTAATLGVTIDELMGSFATLTGVSGNTAEVSTQLAAIFTALIKPSSEAMEMAQQMGVQFDAAAIKAAGGMRNFLQQLSVDISQYAAEHDVLEQEIYGKLFGSAEALRALIPLTGELSDTFGRNIEAMADSEGTIDQAFEQMAGSGESVTQMLENQLTTMLDWAGSIASSIQPYVSFIAVTGQAIAGITLMGSAAKKAVVAIIALTGAQKKNAIVSALAAMHEKIQMFALNLLTSSSLTATAGTWALTAAVTALYAALTLGISLVITGLVSLFTSMGDEAEEAAEQVDVLQQSTDAFKNTAADTKAEIDMEIVALSTLIKQHKDETEKVEELNRKYGKALGNHASAAEWYDTLISKSKAYCTQIGYEAQARVLASQIAAKTLERDQKMQRFTQLNGQYWDKKGRIHYNFENVKGGKEEWESLQTEIGQLNTDIQTCETQYNTCITRMTDAQAELQASVAKTTQEVKWQSMNYADLGKAIESQKSKIAQLAGVDNTQAKKESDELKRMEARYKSLGQKYGLTTSSSSGKGDDMNGKKLIANAKSYKELGNNIAYYEKQLEKTDPKDKAAITAIAQKIAKLKDEQAAIKAVMDAAGRPTELNTLDAINQEITYQQNLRRTASADNIAGIDSEIKRLNGLKTAIEDASHTAVGIEQLHTYEQLDSEISFYENKLKRSTETERVEIQRQINELRKLRKEWDETLDALDTPEDITRLNTIEKLEDAISYYENRQKKASASEIEDIQRTVSALESKRNALSRLTDIPTMQQETDKLGGLSGKRLTMELELIGLDGIKTKIRTLQKMLDDVDNPLGDKQRAEVKKLLGTWQDYELQLKKSQIKLTDAWGSIKGIGGGVESITSALQGNGNAWQKVTGIIDGVIGLYDGFKAIIQIVQTLTAISAAHAAAKTVEAAAETTETTTNIASGTAAITTSIATTAALGAETAAWSALSAAKTFAAHAYIPFVGTAIAAGYVAAQQAVILAAAIPKFKDGGIAYGPTLGIFGEYSGASNNPEVVAPLDKLKAIIGFEGTTGMDGKVEFKIKGRRLMGVLEREDKVRKRR